MLMCATPDHRRQQIATRQGDFRNRVSRAAVSLLANTKIAQLCAISATFVKKRSRYCWLGSPFVAPLRSARLVLDLSLVAAGDSMLKFVIVSTVTLAFVGTAVAADLPRRQPVAEPAPVGKYPIVKSPMGKYPVGKYPVAPAPAHVVTKG